jgi:HPt (histidine-containing phosphotransfer) domain-containing protein
MNDYLIKPIDEKLLRRKIIDLVKDPVLIQDEDLHIYKPKCIDLTYLVKRTKANPGLMMEMIELYLKQTPSLISKMKEGVRKKDWDLIFEAAHKLIPSFSIVGIHKDFETIARLIQEYSGTKKHLNKIRELALQLEKVCSKACDELEEYCSLKRK